MSCLAIIVWLVVSAAVFHLLPMCLGVGLAVAAKRLKLSVRFGCVICFVASAVTATYVEFRGVNDGDVVESMGAMIRVVLSATYAAAVGYFVTRDQSLRRNPDDPG